MWAGAVVSKRGDGKNSSSWDRYPLNAVIPGQRRALDPEPMNTDIGKEDANA